MWPTWLKGCFCFMFLYYRSNVFETHQMLLLLFCLKKDQFWFLLMLRTSSAKVRRKKRCREIQIAQPPRQLLGLQMKDIYHIYNFVERLFFWLISCIEGVKVAQRWGKITKLEAFLRTQFFFTTYFVRTGNPK